MSQEVVVNCYVPRLEVRVLGSRNRSSVIGKHLWWVLENIAISGKDGRVIWRRDIQSFLPANYTTAVSRNTPAFNSAGTVFALGTIDSPRGAPFVLGVNANDGSLLWRTQVDDHPAAIAALTNEIPGYKCCSFRGSMVKINMKTGKIEWKTYMTPDGFSGVAVWGSSPSIDIKKRRVYIGTGNNFEVPSDYRQCLLQAGSNATQLAACSDKHPTNRVDSLVALDLDTGAVKWSRRLTAFDIFTVACADPNTPNPGICPDPVGPDFDFGQAPMQLTVFGLIAAAAKSGYLTALRDSDGTIAWTVQLGPGSTLGAGWGSTSDGRIIYAQVPNFFGDSWPLSTHRTLRSRTLPMVCIVSAIDAKTGKILWQTPNPLPYPLGGPVTLANSVVFSPSADPDGHLWYFCAKTGKVLGSTKLRGTNMCGPAIVNGRVFGGSGYKNQFDGQGVGGTWFTALGLP
ncbi:pyrrolo-quinoline quinone [Cladochytrium replicatum]|nr:pyrrolo-quinoline quinone [Cladochytrium replicatum]